MPDTGWISPGSFTQLSGGDNWINPANAFDANESTAATGNEDSKGGTSFLRRLHGYNLNLASILPASFTVDGIELRYITSDIQIPQVWMEIAVPGKRDVSTLNSAALSSWTARPGAAAPYDTSDRTLDGSKSFSDLGGSTSDWGLTIADTDVVSSNFGPMLACSYDLFDGLFIYEVYLKVYYTALASDPMSVRDGGTWKTASPYVNDGGIWKPATPNIKDGGIWKSS
jgi:hypothetical protein